MKGNIFSCEDKEFMETVHSDLNKYLRKTIFPSRTVLVFPPFNGFRRFLIHKLIEDNFSSSEVAAFSIGQDIGRRIVVCYKGLIKEELNKGIPSGQPVKAGLNMIEKERQRQKSTPTAAVYRPPAARIAESRRSTEDGRPDTKRCRVRRPDQQVYVPRPKRASFGNEQPRSRSQSSSRTSLDSDSCDKSKTSPSIQNEQSSLSRSKEAIHDDLSEPVALKSATLSCSLEITCKGGTIEPSCSLDTSVDPSALDVPVEESIGDISSNTDLIQTLQNVQSSPAPTLVPPTVHVEKEVSRTDLPNEADDHHSIAIKTAGAMEEDCAKCDKNYVTNSDKGHFPVKTSSTLIGPSNDCSETVIETSPVHCTKPNASLCINENVLSKKLDSVNKPECSNIEDMETISISSDSRVDQSSSSSSFTTANSSESSSDSEVVQKPRRHKSCDTMETEDSVNEMKKSFNSDRSSSREQNLKNRRIFPNVPVSDVLIISDTSSSTTTSDSSIEKSMKVVSCKNKIRKSSEKEYTKLEKSISKSKEIDPSECDWESLYDDSGECLVPDLMEELTNSVGSVRVTSVNSDYRPYQSVEERTNDGECVIEIYDFPAEFKTTDLFNIFAAYRNKNFQIKWVDDTHALGVFPSPLMADEVLACTLPFVKTRPLRLGIAESRIKARNLVLPSLPSVERPKTCTALARRLVSGALGLRLPTSSQEREKERQVLKEAREKRRMEAKQREAVWDGSITNSSCI